MQYVNFPPPPPDIPLGEVGGGKGRGGVLFLLSLSLSAGKFTNISFL